MVAIPLIEVLSSPKAEKSSAAAVGSTGIVLGPYVLPLFYQQELRLFSQFPLVERRRAARTSVRAAIQTLEQLLNSIQVRGQANRLVAGKALCLPPLGKPVGQQVRTAVCGQRLVQVAMSENASKLSAHGVL